MYWDGFKCEELKIDSRKSLSFKVYGITPSTVSVLTKIMNACVCKKKKNIHVFHSSMPQESFILKICLSFSFSICDIYTPDFHAKKSLVIDHVRSTRDCNVFTNVCQAEGLDHEPPERPPPGLCQGEGLDHKPCDPPLSQKDQVWEDHQSNYLWGRMTPSSPTLSHFSC